MHSLKRISLSIILLYASVSFCQAQNIQFNSVGLVVFEMAQHNIYESSTIGYASLKSKQYGRFRQLITMATPEQLFDLAANHHNAVVRLYSFQALKHKKINIPVALAEQFKNDNTMINIYRGCVSEVKSISNIANTVFPM